MKKTVLILCLALLLIQGPRPIPAQDNIGTVQRIDTIVYTPSEPITINSDSVFHSMEFPGSGIQQDPYIISCLHIESQGICIEVSNTSVSFMIVDCKLVSDNAPSTLMFTNVTRGSVHNCVIGGAGSAIHLLNSQSVFINASFIRGAETGLLVEHSIQSVFQNNWIHSCGIGVRVESTSFCDVVSNSIYANQRGIVVGVDSIENEFNANRLGYNMVSEVSRNAVDNGTDNNWESNQFSDFEVNETYTILGSGNISDLSANLLFDDDSPEITSQRNIVFINGTTDHVVKWNASDMFPVRFELYLNNSRIDSGWWDESSWIYDVSTLLPDKNNITFVVFDGVNLTSRDVVIITVLENVYDNIATVYVALASGLSVVLVVVVLYLLRKFNR